MPSISTSTRLPGFIDPTPTEVPHRMTSPGKSVRSNEMSLTSRATEKGCAQEAGSAQFSYGLLRHGDAA